MSRTALASPTGIPRVNLLPPSEVARREREVLAGRWIWAVVGAVVLSALLVAGAWAWNQFAQQQLAAEQNRSTTLLQQIGSLSEVSGALSTERELNGFLAEAMGSDLVWQDVRAKVESVLPGGVALVGFDLIPGAPATAPVAEEDAAASAGLSGTITLDSPNTLDIATIAERLRGVGAIVLSDANALAESTVVKGRFTYTIDVTFDQSIYTGRYAVPAEGENG